MRSAQLSNLVDELILLLSNTPWMCASLAQLLPLLSAASKDLVRQQQVEYWSSYLQYSRSCRY